MEMLKTENAQTMMRQEGGGYLSLQPIATAELGMYAVQDSALTYEQLDSSFNTGRVVFSEGRTYYDGELIDGVNTLF